MPVEEREFFELTDTELDDFVKQALYYKLLQVKVWGECKGT